METKTTSWGVCVFVCVCLGEDAAQLTCTQHKKTHKSSLVLNPSAQITTELGPGWPEANVFMVLGLACSHTTHSI